ncbi:MAG: hypothetical protein LUD83_07440 [Clostridiales bacterium]|nr:hypothetical protein [Clostridiales bacterium]
MGDYFIVQNNRLDFWPPAVCLTGNLLQLTARRAFKAKNRPIFFLKSERF